MRRRTIPNAQIDVSVCIVSWNTKELLRKCLRSIYKQTEGVSYEIIVVDNDSHDGTCGMVEEEFPDCNLIKTKENLGFVKANNVAIEQAKGRFILFLNPDTKLKSNAIGGMIRFLDRKSKYSAVGCKLVYPDGSIQYVCARTFPTAFNQFCFLAMLDRLFPRSVALSSVELRYWDHKNSREVDCLSGACIMVRRKVIDQVSGFDENIFMYAEDVDLCFRMKKLGWKIYYLADEEIMHYSGASSTQQQNKFFSAIAQRESNCYFIKKHFGKSKARRYVFAIMAGSLIRIIALAVAFPALVALKSRMRNLSYTFKKYWTLFVWSAKEQERLLS